MPVFLQRKWQALLWYSLFSIFFLLSCDYWAWDDTVAIGWWGFPKWIWYFVLLQILFVLGFTGFTLWYWRSMSTSPETHKGQ